VSGYDRYEDLVEAKLSGPPLPQLGVEWLSPAEIAERDELRMRRMARRRIARRENDDDFGQATRSPQTLPPVQVNSPIPVGPNVPEPRPTSAIENLQGPVIVEINEEGSTQGVPEAVAPVQPVQPVPTQNNDDESTVASGTGPRRSSRSSGSTRRRERKTNRKFFAHNWVNYQQDNPKQKIRSSILNAAFL
jgi:hypothetical protein